MNDEASNCITPYFQEALQVLLANAARDDSLEGNSDLMNASYQTMTDLVQCACTDSNEIIFQLLVPILQLLEQTLNPQNISPEVAIRHQDLLCGLIQVCLVQVGQMVTAALAQNI